MTVWSLTKCLTDHNRLLASWFISKLGKPLKAPISLLAFGFHCWLSLPCWLRRHLYPMRCFQHSHIFLMLWVLTTILPYKLRLHFYEILQKIKLACLSGKAVVMKVIRLWSQSQGHFNMATLSFFTTCLHLFHAKRSWPQFSVPNYVLPYNLFFGHWNITVDAQSH